MKRLLLLLFAFIAPVFAHAAAPILASPEAVARVYVPEIGQEMMNPIRGIGAVNLGVDPRYGQDG